MKKRTVNTNKSSHPSLTNSTSFLKIIIVLSIISFVLFILIFPLPFRVFNKNVYYDEFQGSGVFEVIGRNNSEIITFSLLTFFRCDENAIQHINGSLHCDIFLKGNYTYKNKQFSFQEDEQQHLKDVKHLLQIVIVVDYFAFLFLILSLVFLYIYNRRKEKRFLPFLNLATKILFQGSLVLIGIYILIWLVSLNFSVFFDIFHRVFFPMGNYTFSPDSLLITLFPEQFFAHGARWIFVTGFVIALCFLVLSFLVHMVVRKRV